MDIGGGNGNVLSNINNIICSNKENFICVETQNNWIENYNFNNTNISYIFWDNNNINVPDNSIDIVLCMVSLHHMPDELIQTVLININKKLKPNGLLLIKEHDLTYFSHFFIEWDHYLYHILDSLYNKNLNVEEYFNNNIHNFKNKNEWKNIITNYNFTFIDRKNRFLDNYFKQDIKNLSCLYWDIYKKNPNKNNHTTDSLSHFVL